MSRGVNKVIIIGNLGQDPETKYMPSGNAVTVISVATSEQWKDKATSEAKEKTEWHRIVLFNRLAEVAGEYLKKGSKVFIEGALRTRKWNDSTGVDRYTTEIVTSEMQMLDSKPEGQSNDSSRHASGNVAQQNSTSTPPANQAPPMDSFDDDIPF